MTQYIELSSKNRDRTKYPSPSEFEVPWITYSTNDPIILSVPYEVNGLPFPGVGGTSTGNTIQLDPALASPLPGIYTGDVIQFPYDTGNYHEIVSYTGSPLYTVTLKTNAPLGVFPYELRHKIPDNAKATITAVTSSSKFIISNTSNTTIIGKYIRVYDTGSPLGPDTTQNDGQPIIGELRKIVNYDVLTQEITISPSFSQTPGVGTKIEIHTITRDNLESYNYHTSIRPIHENVCYRVQLVNMSIPNMNLQNNGYSNMNNLSHLYVEIRELGSSKIQSFSTNNKHGKNAVFIVPIGEADGFFHNISSPMSPTIKMKLDRGFYVRVFLPNGETLAYNTTPPSTLPAWSSIPDTLSPFPPENLLQINLVLGMTLVERVE